MPPRGQNLTSCGWRVDERQRGSERTQKATLPFHFIAVGHGAVHDARAQKATSLHSTRAPCHPLFVDPFVAEQPRANQPASQAGSQAASRA